MKLPPGIVGNTGLYYACYKLSSLGWNVMPTSRNTRGVDVVCFSPDAKIMRSIQVKSLTAAPAVPLGTNLARIMGDFWIIVNSIGAAQPRAFIMLPGEVRDLAERDKGEHRAYWLPRKKYTDPAFQDRWDRIGVLASG